jgi:hypothetical protein
VHKRLSRAVDSPSLPPSAVGKKSPVLVDPLSDPMKRAQSQRVLEEQVNDQIYVALGDALPARSVPHVRDSLSPVLWARSGFLSTPEGKESRIGVPNGVFRPMIRRHTEARESGGSRPAGERLVRSESDLRKPFPLPRYYFRNPILSA